LPPDRKPTMSLSNYNTRSYHRALPHQNSSKSAWKLDTFIDKSSGQSREIIVLADTPSPTPNSGPSKSNGLARSTNNNVCTSQSPPPNRHSYSLIHSLSQAIQSTVKSKRKYENYSSGQQREETREAKRHEPERLPVDDKEGHYIVRPDDMLGDHRYQVVKLLGQGTFGKVVQATDLHAPIDRSGRRKEVAVKVIRAVQKYRDASKIEIKVLNLLRERDPDNVNDLSLTEFLSTANAYICSTCSTLQPHLYRDGIALTLYNQYSPFPASHIQSFAKQLLSSVAFLHDLRLVHTDLKPENILLLDASAHLISTKRGANKSKKVLRCSDIRLIDFGSATFEDEYHASVVSTRHYRAPEIILNMQWSFPCDVWSIGCILVEFFTGEALFQTHENLEHLAMMEAVFGPMPEQFARRATMVHQKLSPRLSTVQHNSAKSQICESYAPSGGYHPPNIHSKCTIRDLLSKLLEWEPHKRITVKEALKHSYFTLKIDDEGTIY
ncbi:hypothetical protein PSTT_00921, partial [Puccinia striiformis]